MVSKPPGIPFSRRWISQNKVICTIIPSLLCLCASHGSRLGRPWVQLLFSRIPAQQPPTTRISQHRAANHLIFYKFMLP